MARRFTAFPPCVKSPENKWLDIAMIRMNHQRRQHGRRGLQHSRDRATSPKVVTHVHQVRKEGMGVISMKLVGEGMFNRETARRQ